MKINSIRRCLSVFEKNGDKYLGDISFEKVPSLHILKDLFEVEEDSVDGGMYDDYFVTEKEIRGLQSFCKENLDIAKYDYFLTCYGEYERDGKND